MKKRIIILLLLISSFGYAQTEKENYKKVKETFKTLYNEENYKAIFGLFDDAMKKALPLDKTISFFQNNVGPAGKITKMEFSKTKGPAHIYKTNFERAILDILISLDANNNINGFYATLHQDETIPVIERNSTKMRLPFNEEWTVFWGGTNETQNYHVAYANQKYAYDLVIMKNGKTHIGDPKKNENYYVFGKKIIAPCDAKVVNVITGVKDNVPGEMNPRQVTGNTVVLETAKGEFILMAHFKERSIVVKEGQQVKQGDLLGLCGNSGNSSEAHLHLSLQNTKNMNSATGGKLFFEEIKVNGKIKKDYLPVKNDNIQNIKL